DPPRGLPRRGDRQRLRRRRHPRPAPLQPSRRGRALLRAAAAPRALPVRRVCRRAGLEPDRRPARAAQAGAPQALARRGRPARRRSAGGGRLRARSRLGGALSVLTWVRRHAPRSDIMVGRTPMRLMLGISILVSLSPTLSAKEPALVPSEQGKMRLLAPSGWTVSVDESQGVVVFARDPAKADAPILLLVAKDSGTIKEDELIDTLVSSAGAGFKVIDRGRLSSGGLQLVEEGKHQGQGMTLRLGAVVLEHEPHILVGLL